MGGEGSTFILVSGVMECVFGASFCSGVNSREYDDNGLFAGVNEKLSSGLDSGGDMRFAIDGSFDMLGEGGDDGVCRMASRVVQMDVFCR